MIQALPILLFIAGQQWSNAEALGKTPDQVVKMGRTAFTEAYEAKHGSSTVAMVEGEMMFGQAVSILSDRAIHKLPPSKRAWYAEVRKQGHDFSRTCEEVGFFVTGGGTIWQNYSAGMYTDLEVAIQDSLAKKPVSGAKLASFDSLFVKLRKAIRGNAMGQPADVIKEARKSAAQLQKQHKVLSSLLSKGSKADVLRFSRLMVEGIGLASGQDR